MEGRGPGFKELHLDIGIQKIYTKYEEDFYEDITEMIDPEKSRDTHTQKVSPPTSWIESQQARIKNVPS